MINIQNIYKNYNNKETRVIALNNISLSIDDGEFVAIIGKSGSGKSTLMNILGCLDTPTSGKYILMDKDVSNLCENELAHIRNQTIGFIFQGFNLIPNLTALENVELPLIYRNIKKSNREILAKESLCKVGLKNRMHHKPNQMSGGQQQRVAIARAIAGNPPLIFADEPTGNLDQASSVEILQILKQLHFQGHTLVLITHDNSIANEASRQITINDGKILA